MKDTTAPPVDDIATLQAMQDTIAGSKFWYTADQFAKLKSYRQYIIRNWLIADGLTWILAKRGAGKSTVALDLGCHLACDMPWQGIAAREGWCVIYICAEDTPGMILNLRAWAKHHGKLPAWDRLLVTDGAIMMGDPEDMKHRMEQMKAWVHGRKCLVIMDTWQRSMVGFSANDQTEMDVAVAVAEKMTRELNGAMLVCCHPPKKAKDGELTIRGSAIQEDTSCGLWELVEQGYGIELTNTRAKGKGRGGVRKFKFETIHLDGEPDYFGDPLEGIVPVKIGGTEDSTAEQMELDRKHATAWGELVRIVMAIPGQDDKPIVPTCRSVSERAEAMLKDSESLLYVDWRPIAEAAGIAPSHSKSTIKRAIKKYFDPDRGLPLTVDFDNGTRLTMKRRKNPHSFVIVKMPDPPVELPASLDETK